MYVVLRALLVIVMFKKVQKSRDRSAIYSSALQDHIIRKSNLNLDLDFGFKIPKTRAVKQSTTLPSIQPRPRSINPKSSSILPYESEDIKRLKDLYDQTTRAKQYKKKLTLAQRLGIITAPPPPLSADQWDKIQAMSKNRKDSQNVCSICLQDFKLNPQTILSCSHVFHLNCLTSFQKHNKIKACPICRRQDYEKKVIDEGIRIFTMKCISKLQKCIRGSQCRKNMYQLLLSKAYKASSMLFGRRLIGYKMQRFSIKMHMEAKKKQIVYKKLFDKVQQQIKISNEQIFQRIVQYQKNKIKNKEQLDSYLQNNQQHKEMKKKQLDMQNKLWNEAKMKAIQRNDKTCSICLMNLGSKETYLLSCSHTFHVNCINSFQRYSVPNNICPCCRCQYQKVVFKYPSNN